MRGGATIWNTPALDPELGLVYFAVGNCGPDYDGSMREGDNLFCASIVALKAKTGEYAWHFQQVHHDIWDYDAASPVVLFDTVINGQPRKGIAEAGRTGWVYILDRTNGKPLIGIEERPVPQEPRQKTAKTQPYPIGDAIVPQCAEPPAAATRRPAASSSRSGKTPVLISRRGSAARTGRRCRTAPTPAISTCPARCARARFARYGDTYIARAALCRRHPVGADRLADERHVHGDRRQHQQDRLAAQDALSHRRRRRLDRHRRRPRVPRRARRQFLALDAKTGEELWRFQTGFGADAPPVVYEVDGDAVRRHRDRRQSAPGQRVWRCGVGVLAERAIEPAVAAATRRTTLPGRADRSPTGVNTVNIGVNNVEYCYVAGRTRLKAGTAVTFTNVGDIPHTATALPTGATGTPVLWPRANRRPSPSQSRELLLLHLHAASVDVRAGHRRVAGRGRPRALADLT